MCNIDDNKLIVFIQEKWDKCPMCGSKEFFSHPKKPSQSYGLVAVDHVNENEVSPKDVMLLLIPIICKECGCVHFISEIEFRRLLKDKEEMDDEDAI